MGYDLFEITETSLQFDRSRLPGLLAAARKRGYLADHDPSEAEPSAEPEVDQLDALLSEIFPCNHELDADLRAGDFDFEWWPGERFPVSDVAHIFAEAATAGSTITFLDFTEGDRDVYDVVFDGVGGYSKRYFLSDGVPVRAPAA